MPWCYHKESVVDDMACVSVVRAAIHELLPWHTVQWGSQCTCWWCLSCRTYVTNSDGCMLTVYKVLAINVLKSKVTYVFEQFLWRSTKLRAAWCLSAACCPAPYRLSPNNIHCPLDNIYALVNIVKYSWGQYSFLHRWPDKPASSYLVQHWYKLGYTVCRITDTTSVVYINLRRSFFKYNFLEVGGNNCMREI